MPRLEVFIQLLLFPGSSRHPPLHSCYPSTYSGTTEFWEIPQIICSMVTSAQDWSGQRGSNPQHPAWEAGALPVEL